MDARFVYKKLYLVRLTLSIAERIRGKIFSARVIIGTDCIWVFTADLFLTQI